MDRRKEGGTQKDKKEGRMRKEKWKEKKESVLFMEAVFKTSRC